MDPYVRILLSLIPHVIICGLTLCASDFAMAQVKPPKSSAEILDNIAGNDKWLNDVKPDDRRYDDGPLNPSDFQAESPPASSRRYAAFTETAVRWTFTYETKQAALGRVVAKVKSLKLHAVLLPKQCWNTRKEDRQLMSHEQGHFDIVQIFVLEIQSQFNPLKQPLTAEGRSTTSAVQQLHLVVEKFMQPKLEKLPALHRHYDELTIGGNNVAAQVEVTADHAKRLLELNEQLKRTTTAPKAITSGAKSERGK